MSTPRCLPPVLPPGVSDPRIPRGVSPESSRWPKSYFNHVFSWMPLRCILLWSCLSARGQVARVTQLCTWRWKTRGRPEGDISPSPCASASQLVVFKNNSRGVRVGSCSDSDLWGQGFVQQPCQSSTSPVSEKDLEGIPWLPGLSHRSSWKGTEPPLMPGRAG